MTAEMFSEILNETKALAEMFERCVAMQNGYADKWSKIADVEMTPEQKAELELAVGRIIATGAMVK